MLTTIVSDRIAEIVKKENLKHVLDDDVSVISWIEFSESLSLTADILVLDLFFDQHLRDIEGILGQSQRPRRQIDDHSQQFHNIFEFLARSIPEYLETGNIVIGLMNEPAQVINQDTQPPQLDSLAWLSMLSVVESYDPIMRAQLTGGHLDLFNVRTNLSALDDYLRTYAQGYTHVITLNEDVVTDPDILATGADDDKPIAVAFDQGMFDHDTKQFDGQVVLLPPPRRFELKPQELVDTLVNIGAHYYEDRKMQTQLINDIDSIDLEELIAGGETESVEFKEQIPDSFRDIPKEMVAFANQAGGILLMGVADDGSLTGVPNPKELEERVSQAARKSITPSIDPQIEHRTIDGEDIVLICVSKSTEPCSMDDRAYIRIGTTIDVLSPQEIVDRYS